MPARHGQSTVFIDEACRYKGFECLLWPYARAGRADKAYGKLFFDGKYVYAHRLVCQFVHGEPPTSEHHAAHSCGNRLCVTPRHLRWATPTENESDKMRHGRFTQGERKPFAKLTADAVRAIRAQPDRTYDDLGAEYGVSKQTICKARLRQTWRHVE